MKRDFYADLHDDIIDDEYDNSENISTSQASPIRHPEVTSKSGTRYIFFHNRRRKHHLPSWMIKLQHLDWWGKHDGEYSLGRIQRRLDALLICPPVKIMSHYRVLEINYLHDRGLWLDFSSAYSYALGVYPDNCLHDSFRFSSLFYSGLWGPDLESIRKIKLKEFQDAVKEALPEYEEFWPSKIESLKRAITSAQKQTEILRIKREKRIAHLKETHGKTPRYLDHQRVLYGVDEFADPYEEDSSKEEREEHDRENRGFLTTTD